MKINILTISRLKKRGLALDSQLIGTLISACAVPYHGDVMLNRLGVRIHQAKLVRHQKKQTRNFVTQGSMFQ